MQLFPRNGTEGDNWKSNAHALRCAEGSEIETRSADHSVRKAETFFRLHFRLLGWPLVALSYFEDLEVSLSNYLKPSISSSVNCGHVATGRAGRRIREYWQKCGCCLEK